MPVRKYAMEMCLELRTTHWHLVQLDQLKVAKKRALEVGARFNLYAILERPKVRLDPTTLRLTTRMLEGTYLMERELTIERKDFRLPLQFDVDGASVESVPPYTRFRILRENKELSEAHFSHVALYLEEPALDAAAFDIMYFGQAKGNSSGRDAIDRLTRHETLQKIQHDVINMRTWNEIWLLLFDFSTGMMTSMGTTPEQTTIDLGNSLAHIKSVQGQLESDRRHFISLAEAALIYHFQTEYNTNYKGLFPDPNHGSYSKVYERDFNCVSIAFGTASGKVPVITRSKKVAPSLVHSLLYPLHDSSEREFMFEGMDLV